MLVLKQEQRALLAEKLADAANLAMGALVFGQFLGERSLSPLLAFVGFGLWIVFLGWAIVMAVGDE
jgi:hypothetical protein